MAAIPPTEWKAVGKLYQSGQPMRLVAKHYGVSIDAVVYVLRKISIPRRSFAEANRIRFENNVPSFSIKPGRDKKLEPIGAMLYWAEGHKSASAAGIDFANSDPDMVELFMQFLRDRYALDEKRFRAFLYCHADQDISGITAFWSTRLTIPEAQFTRPYIKPDSSSRSRKMPHGMIHVRYSDKKLLRDMLNLIESYRLKYCVGGRVVNYTTL